MTELIRADKNDRSVCQERVSSYYIHRSFYTIIFSRDNLTCRTSGRNLFRFAQTYLVGFRKKQHCDRVTLDASILCNM